MLYLAGAAGISFFPGPRAVVVTLLLAWVGHGIHECRQLAAHYARVSSFTLDASGVLEIAGKRGRRSPACRLPGTVVLERAIWLRFRDAEGRIGTELFTGSPRRDAQFRRAAVLLRLSPATRKN